jgi:hypothetical protein
VIVSLESNGGKDRGNSLDTALVISLEKIVSAQRLQRYRNAGSGALETAVLYCWNVQLGEALMPSLAILEVTLRNAVHDTLTALAGNEFWFKSVLHTEKYNNVLDVIGRITKRQGYPPLAGKVISEITFGFWPLIFAKSYNSLWWSQPTPLLASVLPNHPKLARDTRVKFEERLEYFASLRNRVMHQEAIFQGVAAVNRPVLPIDTLHNQLIETIEWISTDAGRIARCLDRFDDVFNLPGRASLETNIKTEFNIP